MNHLISQAINAVRDLAGTAATPGSRSLPAATAEAAVTSELSRPRCALCRKGCKCRRNPRPEKHN